MSHERIMWVLPGDDSVSVTLLDEQRVAVLGVERGKLGFNKGRGRLQ